MNRIINNVLFALKYLLFIICVVFTGYIIIYMYHRLDKNLLLSISVFIPYFILFILFIINIISSSIRIKKSLFYNFTCCFVFLTIIFVNYRTLFDSNMILYNKLGYGINFNYFNDFIIPMQIMLYGLSFSNILLLCYFKSHKKLTVKI